MIEEIRIDNLGVIGRAHVELGPGLTVLTGETGAGKTMVLTALNLLLGGKADPATVRVGSTSAAVEGRVVLAAGGAALERAAEAGAELDDDGSLVLLRTVGAGTDGLRAGRARYVGGRSVPQGVLAELADELVTVHGQADQARLRSPAVQREALDEFVGAAHREVLARYRAAWAERARVDAELTDLVDQARDRTREAELLRLGLAEVERVDPQPAEDVTLAEEVDRLSHAEDLRTAAAGAHAALVGEDGRRRGRRGGRHDRAGAPAAGARGHPRPGARRAGHAGRRGGVPARGRLHGPGRLPARTCRRTRCGSTPRSVVVPSWAP